MMRIQKYLSQKRILSRREAEDYIRKGLIKLNGVVVREMGVQIDPEKDRVEVLAPTKEITAKKTLAFNKPRGLATEEIPIFLPEFRGLNAVGRLDKESEGLILLSNDGAVTAAVTGDKHTVEKEYEVTVRETVNAYKLRKMAAGVRLEDGPTLPAKTKLLGSHAFVLVLKEGRKHQIRRMAAVLQLTVTKLKRIRVGNVALKGIQPGRFRILTGDEVSRLKGQL